MYCIDQLGICIDESSSFLFLSSLALSILIIIGFKYFFPADEDEEDVAWTS